MTKEVVCQSVVTASQAIGYGDYLISVIAIVGMWLTRAKNPNAWILSGINQILWLIFALKLELWGFVILSVVKFIMSIAGYYKWKADAASP